MKGAFDNTSDPGEKGEEQGGERVLYSRHQGRDLQ